MRENIAGTFDDMFKCLECNSIYTSPLPEHAAYVACLRDHNMAIIDNPVDKMENEMLSFEAERLVATVIDIAEILPGTRNKPVLGVVCGMGGGKTRLIEELRRALLMMHGRSRKASMGLRPVLVLPFAFTFNSTMDLNREDYTWSSNPDVCFACSVVVRLASVFYGLSLATVETMISSMLSMGVGQDRTFPVELIRGFLMHAVRKVPNATTVVVMVDEILKAEDGFQEKFPLELRFRPASILHEALLDDRIAEGVDAALVISSLTVTAMGLTTSGRRVVPLILPALKEKDIVKKWWKCEEESLNCLAAALAPLPRSVEIAATFLKDCRARTVPLVVSPELVKDFWLHLIPILQQMYSAPKPSEKHMRNAIYGEEIDLNDVEMKLIKYSIFTNSLRKFNVVNGEAPVKFIPQVSLALLAAGASEKISDDTFMNNDVLAVLLRDFLKSMETTVEGAPLEWCMQWWLKMRLAVILGEKDFSLSKFLGINNIENPLSSSQVDHIDVITFNVPALIKNIVQTSDLPCSANGKEIAFIQYLSQKMMHSGQVFLFKPHKKERFDHLFVICDKDGPFLVFMDDKSRAIDDGSRDIINLPPPIDTSQADYVANTLIPAANDIVEPGPLVKALADKRYAFLYMSSCGGKSYTTENAIVLMQPETKRFLGPLWSVYRSIRAGVISKYTADKVCCASV